MWTKRAPAALVAVSSGPRLFSPRRLPGSLPSLARAQPTYVAHCTAVCYCAGTRIAGGKVCQAGARLRQGSQIEKCS